MGIFDWVARLVTVSSRAFQGQGFVIIDAGVVLARSSTVELDWSRLRWADGGDASDCSPGGAAPSANLRQCSRSETTFTQKSLTAPS